MIRRLIYKQAGLDVVFYCKKSDLGRLLSFTCREDRSFWHVKLDHKSSYLTTFNMRFGRYQWNRMPFGIQSALEVFQRKLHELIQEMLHVEVQTRVQSSHVCRNWYGQIKKEFLAIVFACKRFHTYIYGRKAATVETDHKPLEAIVHEAPNAASQQLQ